MVASYTIEYAPIFSSLLSLVDRVAQVNPKSQAPNELHGLPFAQLNVVNVHNYISTNPHICIFPSTLLHMYTVCS